MKTALAIYLTEEKMNFIKRRFKIKSDGQVRNKLQEATDTLIQRQMNRRVK